MNTDNVRTVPAAPQWDRIPNELRQRVQWALAGSDKAPRTILGSYASSTDRRTWAGFEHVAHSAWIHGQHIGYMLTADDPFSCIDLDVCDEETQRRKGEPVDQSKWTTREQYDRYWRIVQAFDSYTEISTSGKGLHVWVKGKIGPGCRRDGVEVYSQERFIISTGNVLLDRPIADRQDLLNSMVSQMRPPTAEPVPDEPDSMTDEQVYLSLLRQVNSPKFTDLWTGEWRRYGYPSQSEADEALIAFLCFRSQSNAQVRRLFRYSALGQRKKAQRDDYLNRTINRIRVDQAVRRQAMQLVAELMAPAIDRAMGRRS